jgi:hypothetical protein
VAAGATDGVRDGSRKTDLRAVVVFFAAGMESFHDYSVLVFHQMHLL